ncbi:response regulator transcription factor [Cryptosporangium aurantiacum]|uniref:Two-component system, OmpR family, response regulator n=1 Tax=Cryptosporangium aurantiacum TaxID=134849 RepID=A0A1M7Q4Z1_9ACTN|nr:response regulator transcription factor [Cryptosporangium aurantiacum]SHN25424.1 two-component system, OmpR family, response regulator [Cryptosporangium aurantiacum]
MSGQPSVLIVDDQANIVDMVATVLRFHGFAVTTAGTAAEALRRAAADRPDIVVLDVLLPDGDGFQVCRTLRADGHDVGIVFLTARDGTGEKVAGLSFGGDDYLTKPFSVDELVARVRAVLRRVRPAAAGASSSVLVFADVELDDDACQVRRGGRLVPLSPTEFKLLRYLMQNPNRVLSRGQILDAVWSYDFAGTSNVVDTYVGYLRRKLEQLGPPVISTRRGFGYVLEAPR